jgi:hypothetical protein
MHCNSCEANLLMRCLGALIPSLTLSTMLAGAAPADETKFPAFPAFPDWQGAWARFVVPGLGGQPSFDQTKSWGRGQQAPLTVEYQKVLEDSLADQAQGGQGNFIEHAQCLPAGMPLMMVAFRPLEFVITPATTYVLVGGSDHYRRIFTDGREWPHEIDPSFSGYSIGRWVDAGGSGRYDTLEVETRGPFKGHRAYDATGLPLAFDNQSLFLEKIRVDQADANLLHDEITVIDHALTRPWTVDKTYRRSANARPKWREFYCVEGVVNVVIGKENYYLSADGLLMPAKKNQMPPDLKYFKQVRN